MTFYKMRRYQQLVFRTTPDSLLEWLDGELEKRGIDCVYTHFILSILQEDSDDADPDECMDGRNSHKIYRKLESLYSATKSKHQKWKSYSKQILLTTNIPSFDVGVTNREQKNKIVAINCLKSVSDDNSIEELIDEVCMKLKNIRNKMAPEKKDLIKSTNKVDKDTAFYIPPSSPTDQVEKYFAAFPPLNRKEVEETIDSNQITCLNICYAKCIRQSKGISQNVFLDNSCQNSENSKSKQGFSDGSLKSIENIYQPKSNKFSKHKFSQLPDHNADNLKFIDENNYSGTAVKNWSKFDKSSAKSIMNSDRNGDLDNKCSEKSSYKISRSKSVSQKSKYAPNKLNYRSEKEPDSKRKSALNLKMHSNPKKAKNCSETYFSLNKFSVLMEEETYKLDIDSEECLDSVTVCHSLKLDKKLEASELTCNPCKKLKICENASASQDISDSTIAKNAIAECTSTELSPSCLLKYSCDKEQFCEDDNSCVKSDLTWEIHTEKRKNDFENNFFEEMDASVPYKKLSTRSKYFKCITKTKRKRNKSKVKVKEINDKNNFIVPRYVYKNYSDGFIKYDTVGSPLCDKIESCVQPIAQNFHASTIKLYIPTFFQEENKNDGLTISCFKTMQENTAQSMSTFLKANDLKENYVILTEKNEIESLHITNKALSVRKGVSFNNISENSQVSLYFPLESKRVGQQNCIFSLANINSIIIGNNAYYKFNAFKALKYFSPHEIFNIITTGDSQEVNNFLRKFSVTSDYNLYPNSDILALPDEKFISKTFSCIDLKIPDRLPLKKYPSSYLQSVSEPKEKSASIFSTDFQSVAFKNKNCDNVYSKESFPIAHTQQGITEYKNDAPSNFRNFNCNLFFDLDYKNSDLSGYHNNTKNYFPVTNVSDKEKVSFIFPSRLLLSENDCNFPSSAQFSSIKGKNSIWNIEDKDIFINYNTLSTSSLHKNKFSKTHFPNGEEIRPENKLVCLIKNADNTISPESISGVSSYSAFRYIKKKMPCLNNNLVRHQQNLLRKVTNIDRIIQRISAQNRVITFLNSRMPLALPYNNSTETFPHSYYSAHSNNNSITLDCSMSFNSGIADNISSSNYNLINHAWSKKCTNSEENLRAIWENNSNPVNIIEKNLKPSIEENIYTLFDDFDLESIQNDLDNEDEELLKVVSSISDLKEEKNGQTVPDSTFISSCHLKTNSEIEIMEVNVEEFPRISVPMHDISAKAASEISDHSNFNFSLPGTNVDPTGLFSIENCINTVDSHTTCSDTSYSFNRKHEAYQDSGFIDLSAFRGPYGSYSENKTNYLENGGWSLDSNDFMLGSDTFQYRSSSLHELEIANAENDSFQHEHSDQQHLSSKGSETAQLNTSRLPFVNARRRMKHRCSTSKRPCAFYMEGNCNRTDCKFSHDLSNITCRFWIEGSCFKGSTCPFLHGYVEHQKISHCNFTKSESHNYSLDSEADFPSLSSVKTEKTRAGKSSPVDIVHSKRLKNSRQANL